METVILTVFDILNLVLILFLCVYTLRIFKKLPEKIPTHFDLEGKPDHFGGKRFAFFSPCFSGHILCGFLFYNKTSRHRKFSV